MGNDLMPEVFIICNSFEWVLESNKFTDVSYQYKTEVKNNIKFNEFIFVYLKDGTPFTVNVHCNDENVNKFYGTIMCELEYISFKNEFTANDNLFKKSGLIRLNDIVVHFTKNILNIIAENKEAIKHISDEIDYKIHSIKI